MLGWSQQLQTAQFTDLGNLLPNFHKTEKNKSVLSCPKRRPVQKLLKPQHFVLFYIIGNFFQRTLSHEKRVINTKNGNFIKPLKIKTRVD